MTQSFSLRYGRGSLEISVPDKVDVTVIQKPTMPVIDDPVAAVMQALQNPVSTKPLSQLAKNAASACIAICDITRPVPNHLFLRPMIQTMIDAGVPKSAITVLVATGLQRPNEAE